MRGQLRLPHRVSGDLCGELAWAWRAPCYRPSFLSQLLGGKGRGLPQALGGMAQAHREGGWAPFVSVTPSAAITPVWQQHPHPPPAYLLAQMGRTALNERTPLIAD